VALLFSRREVALFEEVVKLVTKRGRFSVICARAHMSAARAFAPTVSSDVVSYEKVKMCAFAVG
jgi:hypothetical protein